MKYLSTPIAIIIAGLLIALAVLVPQRYEYSSAAGPVPLARVDRLTGTVECLSRETLDYGKENCG